MAGLADIQRVARRIVRTLAIGRVAVVDDTGAQQVAQVQIAAGGPAELQEVIDATPRVGEYGLASCPPAGSEVVLVFLGGRRSAGAIIATGHRASRPKGLKPGESLLYNGLTGRWLKLDADGLAHFNGDVKVDTKLTAHQLIAETGATGSFNSADGKHVTVVSGIITQIA